MSGGVPEVRFGLKQKFSISFILFLICLILPLGYVVSITVEELLLRDMKEKGRQLSKMLSLASKGPMIQSQYDELSSYVSDLTGEQEIVFARILDERLTIIAGSDTSKEKSGVGKNLKGDPEVSRAIDSSPGQEIFEQKVGFKHYTFYQPVIEGQTTYGHVLLGMSDERLRKDTRKTLSKILTIFAGAFFVSLAFSFILSNLIIAPILKLVKGAQAVGEGDLEYQIESSGSFSGDEIGVLAYSLDFMRVNLKRSIENLDRKVYEVSVLYNISQAMNFIPDLNRLLNLILDNAIEALKAERGSIMLSKEEAEGEYLEVYVVRGVESDNQKMDKIKIKPGEGIAGKVFQSEESIISGAGFGDDRFLKHEGFEARESRIQTLVCVPMKVKDYTIGVINIVNKIDGTIFSEEEKIFLEAMASQAALAIDKAKLYELSITDGMTKLFIHRFFQVKLDEELVRSKRYKTEVSLILFDIDHFKKFNDTYGHQQGDLVLIHVAKIIRNTIRDGIDIPARYGGEEFCVICPETGQEGSMILAERLRKAVEDYEFPGQEQTLRVTISMGVSTFPDHSNNKKDLIKLSDMALYRSKNKGRNAVTSCNELNSETG